MLLNKLNIVTIKINENHYFYAINMLLNDLSQKVGDPLQPLIDSKITKMNWIICTDSQQHITIKIDDPVAYLAGKI